MTAASRQRNEDQVLNETVQQLMKTARGFSRLLIVLLTAFSLGYTPIHVITHPHGNSHVEIADHDHHDDDEEDNDHDAEDHAHHHENEHATAALVPGKLKLDTFGWCVLAVIAIENISFERRVSSDLNSLPTEIPQEASPPPPLLPRAPPLV